MTSESFCCQHEMSEFLMRERGSLQYFTKDIYLLNEIYSLSNLIQCILIAFPVFGSHAAIKLRRFGAILSGVNIRSPCHSSFVMPGGGGH